MVSTRRGVRVSSPAKTNPDQSSDVPATPSTGRRTRSTLRQAESPTHHALVETSCQLEKSESGPPVSSSVKRCTRASRLHSPEQPCTPVGSTHEADMSDLESCCSVVSDAEPPATRSRGKRRPTCAASQEDEISEVESCSSAVSVSNASQVSRRSTRRKTKPECSDPAPVAAGEVKVDLVLENESCSSVVSESKRVTRSQRKTARTRSAAKRDTEDSEVSDADSCASIVSTAEVSRTTTRRATKSRMSAHHIPFDLDEASDRSHSPAPRGQQTRAARGKAIATVDARESLSPDSEGFESGPTYSMTTRRRGKSQSTGPKALDSDSDRGTPCSSRTGSGNSSRGVRVTRHAVKELCVVLEKAKEMIEEDSSLNDSRLESTLITEDADCTLLEEHMNQTLEEKEADLTSNEANAKMVERGEVVSEPAVMAKDQQEELSAENKDEDASEVETMQEMIQSSTPLKPCQSVTVTICEEASGVMEEKGQTMDEADMDAHSSQGEKAAGEDASEETRPSVEEEMEVSTLNTDTQQVVGSREVQVESIQVTSSQQHTITVESDSEQQPKDVTVKNTKVLSLLESSDDEDAEEENEVSGEEEDDLGCMEEGERGGPSKMSEAAAASVEGLFMIDTRPGQEVDEHYFKERPTEEEEDAKQRAAEHGEEDEEFVDEEGDDDAEDDEGANILFSSRNPQLKDLSSRIDPGIRVKELGGLYINFGDGKSKPVSSSLKKLKEKKMQDEVMRKSVIGPDFEKMDAVPPYSESKQALKLKHRAEREKSTGDGWFNMKAPELSQELKGDLQVLKMRGSMDPKRFYKKNDRDGFPKYFQVGTVVDSPVDFYHSRVPKKGRKRTMVGELLADAEFRQKNKKKFQQIVTERAVQGAGKRNRKKSKFHKK